MNEESEIIMLKEKIDNYIIDCKKNNIDSEFLKKEMEEILYGIERIKQTCSMVVAIFFLNKIIDL